MPTSDITDTSDMNNKQDHVPSIPELNGKDEQANTTQSDAHSELVETLAFPGIHVHARSLALTVLATIGFIFFLRFAQSFLIPLVFGIFLTYTLNPIVSALQKIKIPRVIAIVLVMGSIFTGIVMHIDSFKQECDAILDQLPVATKKLSNEISQLQFGQSSLVLKVQAAATEFDKATSQATGIKPTPKLVPAQSTDAGFKLKDWLLTGSVGVMEVLGQAIMVVCLVFFLLLSGDSFKRKLVKITGPTLKQKRITVQILNSINTSIQSYMFMLLMTNALLALLNWVAFRYLGLQNAGAWAIASGLLHIIPYFGTLAAVAAMALAALLQFGSLSAALLVAGISFLIATLIGTFLTTWMAGKIAKMNAAALFIFLLFWGWLWGIWGLLLGIPIVVILQVISQHVSGLQHIAELLRE